MEVALAVILGAVFGSFFNVLIYRLPRDMSIVRPGSHCPGCKREIPFYRNIPLVSYALLAGKSACCKTRIPFRYFLVELFSALTFLWCFQEFGLTLHGLFTLLFLSLNLVLFFTDLETFTVPDQLSLGGGALFLGYSFFHPGISPLNAFLTAFTAAGIFFLLYFFYLKVRKIEAMGGGDIKMMIMLGAFLGFRKLLLTILLASLLGLTAAAFLIIFRKKDLKTAVPYVTFLALASYITVIFGDRIGGLFYYY
jgi:leader peptidase (prepilin peptidase)/N-methyltransferase